jgi:subtilase family serine protease
MRKRRGAILALCMFAAIAAAIPSIAGASPARLTLHASAVSFAKPSALVRSARAGERMSFQVYLGLRDPKGAQRFLNRVSDPSSASYTHYLTASGFRSRFGRSQADVSAVRSWMSSQGFRITASPSSGLWITADGTVAQVQRVFGVRMGYYRSADGVSRAPDRAPSIPSTLSSQVRGVDLTRIAVHHSATPPPPPGFRVASPCSGYWAQRIATGKPKVYGDHQPYAICGYTPKQLQSAYGVKSAIAGGNDGSGVTVAVLDAYGLPTMQSDLDTYSSKHGLPQLTITQIVDPANGGSDALQQGWWGEEALDVEAVHSMAPGADIVYRGSESPYNTPLRDSMSDIIDNHRADIITNSWGSFGERGSATSTQMWHDVFIEAGSVGIGVYFSSGDCGDERDPQGACGGAGYRTVDSPTNDPDVTGVGGTSLGVGPLNDRLFEVGWGTANSDLVGKKWSPKPPGYFLYGGGGGTSRVFAEPNYQKSTVPTKLSGWWGGAARVVPDVAAVGDPNTGFLIGITQRFPGGDHYGEYRIGGTSLSSPIFAGLMALADDAAGFAHGFANPALYGLAGTSAFNDVVTPGTTQALVRTNYANGLNAKGGLLFAARTMNQTGTLHTRVGFDDVTGNGTPNGQDFLDGLS